MTDTIDNQDVAREALNDDQLAIYDAIRDHGPVTDDEIVELTGIIKGTSSPRRGDLVKLGLVQHQGWGESALGNRAKVWALVPVEERAAAKERNEGKTRRRPITTFPLNDRLEMVRQLLDMDDVNEAIRDTNGRAWARARGRSQDRQGEIKKQIRENEAALREAERLGAPLVDFYRLRRQLLQSVERVRAAENFVKEELERRNTVGAVIPLTLWPDIADMLDDLSGIANETNASIRAVMGVLGDDVIEGTVIEITVRELPEG